MAIYDSQYVRGKQLQEALADIYSSISTLSEKVDNGQQQVAGDDNDYFALLLTEDDSDNSSIIEDGNGYLFAVDWPKSET